MSMLIEAIARHAARNPELAALDPVAGTPLTYAELLEQVRKLQSEQLVEMDHARPIALQLDHGVPEVLWELALLAQGIPVLSLPPFYTEAQARHAIATSGAQALVTDADLQPLDTAPVELPQGTARITFTSGSTGTPRGVCLSREHLERTARAVVDHVGISHAGRHLALLPSGILLETVAGLFTTLLAGGTYIAAPAGAVGLKSPFRPDFREMLEAVIRLEATSLILVPEYLAGIIQAIRAGGDCPLDLTLVAVGGARVAPALVEQARAAGLPVRQGYGLTECGSVISLQDHSAADAHCAGKPLGHVRISVAGDGEIMVEGALCLGTVGGEAPVSPYPTGDIGRFDPAGNLHVEGRKSNLIVTSYGRNISPEWIEEMLLAQPGIVQCMVFGDGEPRPRALLVPARPDTDLDAAVRSANDLLPAYATVGEWHEVAHFTPDNGLLTGNGRLKREAIAARYCDGDPDFFTELEAATVRQRIAFLSIPQVRAGLAGEISLQAYLDYLTQAFHHVSHTVPLMRAARARLLHRPELVEALDEYIEEETGHEEWILNDIAAAGGDKERARHSMPHQETRAMVEHAYSRIADGNPVSFFGMVYVLESISVALASRGASSVAEKLGLPPAAFTYLTSHGALDQSHMRFFARLVNGLEREEDRQTIVEMAREMFALFGAIFASIELEPVDEAA